MKTKDVWMRAIKNLARRYKHGNVYIELIFEVVWTLQRQKSYLRENILSRKKIKGPRDEITFTKEILDAPLENNKVPLVVGNPLDALIVPKGHADFLDFSPSVKEIVFVDTIELLVKFQKYLEAEMTNSSSPLIVGIDAEWSMYVPQEEKASIVQLATGEKVFILDMQTTNLEALKKFFVFMMTDKIKMIGFDIKQDLTRIETTLGVTNGQLSATCLRRWFLQLIDDGKIKGKVEKKKQYGLSLICQLMLGKQLDKREAKSHWARRPLRTLQIRYAALDAACLLMLYDKLAHLQTSHDVMSKFKHLKI